MTNRYFLKDKDILDYISNNYSYTDTTPVNDEFNTPVFLKVLHWENISLLDQSSMNALLNTKGYFFDHDSDY